MTGGPLALRTVAFGDVVGDVWGAAVQSARAGLVFGVGDTPSVAAEPEWTIEDRVWRLRGEGFELHIEPRGEAALEDDEDETAPGGLQELCRVHGRIALAGAEQTIECAGTRTEVDGIERAAIGSVRVVSAWFGPDEAITAIALRSPRAPDHEDDLIAATLFDPDRWVPVSDPRLSTTYTESGDPARASLELWVADGENEYPRRAAGEAAGSVGAHAAGELALRVAPLRCHSRGLEGAGVYVLASLE